MTDPTWPLETFRRELLVSWRLFSFCSAALFADSTRLYKGSTLTAAGIWQAWDPQRGCICRSRNNSCLSALAARWW